MAHERTSDDKDKAEATGQTKSLESAAQEGKAEARAERLAREFGDWDPRTRLGRMVKEGQIATMDEALRTGLPLREPRIVDALLGKLEDDVLDVNMVQRMTDSGRRINFRVVAVIGTRDGFVGVAKGRGKEVGATIRHTIEVAKTKMIAVRRGCGSWECGCGRPHTVPFAVTGKAGSTKVTLKPAPRGVGLAVGGTAKPILALAGIDDCWTFTKGSTRTTINFAFAAFDALRQASKMRVNPWLRENTTVSVRAGPGADVGGDGTADGHGHGEGGGGA